MIFFLFFKDSSNEVYSVVCVKRKNKREREKECVGGGGERVYAFVRGEMEFY